MIPASSRYGWITPVSYTHLDVYKRQERIERSALNGVNLDDVVLLLNHDGTGIPLARSPKTLALTVTDSGLEMRAELPDTEQGKAVYEAVRRGDLGQMSFAFDIAEQTFDPEKRERTVTQIGAVYEISIVTHAAYPQTHVQARKDVYKRQYQYSPCPSFGAGVRLPLPTIP